MKYKYQPWRAVNDKQSRHILRRPLKVMKKISTGSPGPHSSTEHTTTPSIGSQTWQWREAWSDSILTTARSNRPVWADGVSGYEQVMKEEHAWSILCTCSIMLWALCSSVMHTVELDAMHYISCIPDDALYTYALSCVLYALLEGYVVIHSLIAPPLHN